MFKILKEDGKPVSNKKGLIMTFDSADEAIRYAHKFEPYQSAFTVLAFGRSGLVGAR